MNDATTRWPTQRLAAAYAKSRDLLLAERNAAGHWTGELSSSALSTATAVSALAIVNRRHASPRGSAEERADSNVCELVVRGLEWLAHCQNADGGWGDTDKSLSNIATTMLVQAAFALTGVPADRADLMQRAEAYIERAGGVRGLRKRYGKDKTFAAPILTNAALAGLVEWRQVPALPFELACVPQRWYRFARMPVVSYAIPALVAIGQARFHFDPPRNPVVKMLRRAALSRSLAVVERMQPASGGFLEATPLTSFVAMSLASIGHAESNVVKKSVEFLLASARPDGSWPIDTNLATWLTSLSIGALAAGGDDVADEKCFDWLLRCQHRTAHPYTGAAPGGWGWSDLSGAVPDADDTPAALLALAGRVRSQQTGENERRRAVDAARAGVDWLLGLQNRDGGWPTFCRGWGLLPFDRSGADLTAHAIRALEAWRLLTAMGGPAADWPAPLVARVEAAQRSGFEFLDRVQQDEGCWSPLWFGNQYHPQEDNPVYGTSRVLLAYRDTGKMDHILAGRGVDWLVKSQAPDGGWGGGWPGRGDHDPTPRAGDFPVSSVEETAIAVEALLAAPPNDATQAALEKGLALLLDLVELGKGSESSPIGFYFAKLWYYERLYPLIFTVAALGRATSQSERRAAGLTPMAAGSAAAPCEPANDRVHSAETACTDTTSELSATPLPAVVYCDHA